MSVPAKGARGTGTGGGGTGTGGGGTGTGTGGGAAQTGRQAVINGILNSLEALSRTINEIYVDCLGRTAESSGLAYWSNLTRSSGSLEQTIAAIVASPEWQQKNPGTPVEVYYENQLHRTAAVGELAFWQAVQAGNSLQAVPLGITTSLEFRQGFALNVLMQKLHQSTPPSSLPSLVTNNALTLLQLEAALLDQSSFPGVAP